MFENHPQLKGLRDAMVMGYFSMLSSERQKEILMLDQVSYTPEFHIHIYCEPCDETFEDPEAAIEHRMKQHWDS